MSRVLIIDDDDEFGELTVRRLKTAGFDATFHRGPFGSLKAIQRGTYDVILLDISMPALDGAQIVRLIRETRGIESAKVILYSSMDPKLLREMASEVNVDAFVSKSAPKGELLAKINQVLFQMH